MCSANHAEAPQAFSDPSCPTAPCQFACWSLCSGGGSSIQVTTGTFSSWTLSFIVSHLLPSSLHYSITVPPWWLLPARCQLVSQPVIVTGTESSKTCQLPASLAQLPSLVQGEQHLKSSCHYSRATSLQRGPAELHTGSSYWQPQRRDLIYLFFYPNYLNCCKRNIQKTIACV